MRMSQLTTDNNSVVSNGASTNIPMPLWNLCHLMDLQARNLMQLEALSPKSSTTPCWPVKKSFKSAKGMLKTSTVKVWITLCPLLAKRLTSHSICGPTQKSIPLKLNCYSPGAQILQMTMPNDFRSILDYLGCHRHQNTYILQITYFNPNVKCIGTKMLSNADSP